LGDCWRLGLAGLLEVDLFLELFAKLSCHASGTTDPTADLGRYSGQLLRSQHDECQDKNEPNL
jgi:hypothetical protein